jgi:Protein of unknown function (DUF2971)
VLRLGKPALLIQCAGQITQGNGNEIDAAFVMGGEYDPKDHPKALFKYCRPERTDILTGLKVRFTQPAVFNDIFESFPGAEAPKSLDYLAFQTGDRAGRIMAAHPEWSRRERREFQRDEFKKYQARFKYEKEKSSAERLCEEFHIRHSAVSGIFCVSGKWDNILMWAHYTDDHKGFVVEFDGTHRFFDGLVKIHYSAERPILRVDRSGRGEPDVFYTKSVDWQYEDEYRKFESFGKKTKLPNGNTFVEFPPLAEIDQTNWPIRLVDLPAAAIRRVILGHRCTPATKEIVHEALKKPELKHVVCAQAKPDAKLFKMDMHGK